MHWVRITPHRIIVDNCTIDTHSTGGELLKEVYRKLIGGYPKFFKMDGLCRLGFVASELLLQLETPRKRDCEDRAVVFYNRAGSLCDDAEYQKTIDDMASYYPSPSIFVYTLPNIVTGEIAIRNKYYGETMMSVLPAFDPQVIAEGIAQLFLDPVTTSAITGWLDCTDRDHYDALVALAHKGDPDLDAATLARLYNSAMWTHNKPATA